MHVLVTGATGFVGSHAVAALLEAGHDVRCLVRRPERLDSALATPTRERVGVAVGDVMDPDTVRAALDGCDAVLHAAGTVGVSRANTGSRDVNVEGTRNVVGLAVDAGCDPVVYTSTISVFDARGQVLTTETPLGSPTGPYGRSKTTAERDVRTRQDAGAPVTTFYVGGVFGPDCPEVASGMQGIVGAVNQLMPVTDGGVCIIDVRDLSAMIAASMVPGQGPRHFMAGGRYVDWTEWTDLLGEVTGRQLRRLRVPPSVLRGAGRLLDRIKRLRDFDYPLTYEAALQMTSSPRTDDRATVAALGVEPRPLTETLEDSIRWLVSTGHIDPSKAPRLSEGLSRRW